MVFRGRIEVVFRGRIWVPRLEDMVTTHQTAPLKEEPMKEILNHKCH
jgi:hypothetical protein